MQAIPGGVLPVVVLAMVYQLLPPHEIGKAMGVYGLGVVVAPTAGAQRVASALGLALIVALETSTRAQLTHDRAAMIPAETLP